MRSLPRTAALTLLRFFQFRARPAPNMALSRLLPADLDLFTATPVARDGAALHRVLYVGPLSPESGAAEILIALAGWAEHNPDRAVEICWAGTGDLAGVFDAQPLPSNLTQSFLGDLDRCGLADTLAAASMMIVPLTGLKTPIIEALASGLVLVGDRRTAGLKPIIDAGGSVWTFDARRRPTLADALNGALSADPSTLDTVRQAGRRLVCDAHPGLDEDCP